MFAGNARENRSSTASSFPRRSSTEGDPFSAVDPACSRAPDHRPSTLLVPRAPPSAMENSRTAKIQSTNARALGISSLEPSKKTFQKTYTCIYTFIRSRNRISLASISISNFLEPLTILSFLPDFRRSDSRIRNAVGFKSEVQDRCWSDGRSG